VLLVTFVGGIFFTAFMMIAEPKLGLLVASALAAGAAWTHWRRFRVPITVAVGAGAVIASLIVLVLMTGPEAQRWASVLSFISGVAVFALAMRWDLADRMRETRKSDVAFWLHLLAAPLIVRPIFQALEVLDGRAELWQAVAVVALYVAIALISLAIDRRALMVSALIYVLYAFSALLSDHGNVQLSLAITGFVIAAALLMLSAFWHSSRAAVIGLLPAAAQQRLAPSRRGG
jgi:hypothetical protein